MLLTVDASTLVGELLRRRGQALLSSPEIELYVPSRMWEEAEHELGRCLRIMVSRGWGEAAVVERYLRSAVRIKEERTSEISETVYEHLKEEAPERVTRDPEDWQVVVLALLSGSEILTKDEDFFGCGVATWTARTLLAQPKRRGASPFA